MPTPGFLPRKLFDKMLTSINYPAKQIAVSAMQIDDAPVVYEITASVDGQSETQRHTLGNSQGTGPILTALTLQAQIDGFRQSVADVVAWRANMATITSVVT